MASAASATATVFCRAPDPSPRLAVLGVLGTERQVATRDAIRSTWLPGGANMGILALFALRGIGVQPTTLDEAAVRGDMIFLRSEAAQSKLVGPIWSLFLWYDCALSAWPAATLIGKAETDTWQDLPGVAARVLADLEALRSRASKAHHPPAEPLIYWGVMETFNWNLRVQRPKGCMRARHTASTDVSACATPPPAETTNWRTTCRSL